MERIWIDERDALAIHDRLLALHGGAPGLRDAALLGSALAHPLQRHPHDAQAGVIELAAAYTFGIVRNHPFVDGNKRTGFVVAILFLELNGYRFQAAEDEATQAVLQLAAGSLDEPSYANFLRANSVQD